MKQSRRKCPKILAAARGERCQLNIAGVCNYDDSTTVAAHLQFEGGIIGSKESDFSVCWSCSACHEAIDQRKITDEERWFYMGRGLVRTWKRLIELGVIKL